MGVDAQMLVKTRTAMTQRDLRTLSSDLVEAFWADAFLLLPDWTPDEYETESEVPLEDGIVGRHALRFVRVYTQDGDDITPEHGEQFIEVSLMGRYYGEGYERGNLPLYIAIAEWLEHHIPDARVFYGGDSSGICAEPFDRTARAKAFAHFASVGHRPYHGSFGRVFGNNHRAPVCGFCGPQMVNMGGGRGASFYSCHSCEAQVVRDDASGECEVVTRDDKKDNFSGFSKASDRLNARISGRAA